MNYGSRRRLQTERMAERLEDEMRFLREKEKNDRLKKKKAKEMGEKSGSRKRDRD